MRFRRQRRKLEEPIVQRADTLCANAGCVSIHFSQARESNQTPGIPDRLYYHVRRGIAFWYEGKAEDGVQSKEQQDFEGYAVACRQFYVRGNVRDVFDFLVAHGLWRLPPGVSIQQIAGAPWRERRETPEAYAKRCARSRTPKGTGHASPAARPHP